MGSLVVYSFSSGVFLLAGYLIYKWLLANDNQPGFNRAALLTLYVMALLLPLCRIVVGQTGESVMAVAGVADIKTLAVAAGDQANPIVRVVLWVYLTGMIIVGATTLYTLLRLWRLVNSGERTPIGGCTLVVIDRHDITPFSWGRFIVVSRSEEARVIDLIVGHERAHIRLGHFYDLILAQVVCIIQWYNPASWLMLSELKAVHEYQADRAVIDSGINIHQYQILLIKKTVGVRFQSFANSLNHSNLKKRITMMCKTRTKPARRFRALAAVPALALAMSLLNVPSISGAMTEMSSARLTDKVSGFSTNRQIADNASVRSVKDENGEGEFPDVMAEFPGGMPALMAALCENIKYPAEAYEAKIQGRVVVGFNIGTDGRMSDFKVIKGVDPQLDAEAVRAVRALNATWTPALKNGKPVSCSFALPVEFKLK